MYLGYNTNGLAHHSLPSAIDLLADQGYRGVAITLDHGCLNPFDERFGGELELSATHLARRGMRSVIETGARYLLDPKRKHHPTLVSTPADGQPLRIEFLCRAIDAAAVLGSDCVSLWSGAVQDGALRDAAMQRLCDGLSAVLEYAEHRRVVIGFEPEPGMLIDAMSAYAELAERVASPRLQLTLDVGHLHCQNETPIDGVIREWRDQIVNVHVEDMRVGAHEHLMFGEGEMDFPPIIAALRDIGYDGGVHVELSRHSYMAPQAVWQAFEFLNPLITHHG
jgi:L-ribulose-5-phosphate 3-epimerase